MRSPTSPLPAKAILIAAFWLAGIFAATLTNPGALMAQIEDEGLNFDATIRLGIAFAPDFEGSDDYSADPLPIFHFRYGNFFLSSSRGLGVNIIDNGTFTVAPAINYVFGRDESDNPILAGMGDVNGGLTAGGRLGFHHGPLSVLMDLNFGLGALEGSTIDLGAYYSVPFGERLTGTFGVGTQYATEDRTQARFGVTPEQSARSGYPIYTPGEGLKHVGFSGALTFDLTQSFDIGVFGEYKVLTGPAEDSPLVHSGSRNQVRTGLTMGYHLR